VLLTSVTYGSLVLALHASILNEAIKAAVFVNSLPSGSADLIESGDPPEGWGVRVKRGQSAALART